jgi:hypothetical protein
VNGVFRRAWLPALAGVLALTVAASAQMVDARQMSGIPIPSPDVPPGSVSVRLVRGDLANNLVDHTIELRAGQQVRTAKTDHNGRAIFAGLAGTGQLQAAAVVGGERVESQPFTMPPGAGVRLVLVAGAPPLGAPAAGAVAPGAARGEVVFGGESRIQIEFNDDALEVFYLFELVNAGPPSGGAGAELAFQLPEDAEQASVLEGGSGQVTLRGRMVTISGPIPAGMTPVRLAYSLAPAGPRRVITQSLPARWPSVQVVMARAGNARLSSPVLTNTSEMAGGAQPFVVATGGSLPANQPLLLTLTGLPTRSDVGRYVTLALGALVLLLGIYGAASARGPTAGAARQGELTGRRDRLMAELVRVEEQRRAGMLDGDGYAKRHEDLLGQLERVYAELDSDSACIGQGPSS